MLTDRYASLGDTAVELTRNTYILYHLHKFLLHPISRLRRIRVARSVFWTLPYVERNVHMDTRVKGRGRGEDVIQLNRWNK